MLRLAPVFCFVLLLGQTCQAAPVLGLIDDFEDGTLGGWAPPAGNTSNQPGGPSGSTRFLQIAPAQRLSAFDAGVNGVIAPDVLAIQVDMMRPVGLATPDIRLVLMGPGGGNRWTSTVSQAVPSDGGWNTYTFSIQESDLTRTLGAGTYADLTNNLNRIMFRHDSGGPSPGGTPVAANFGVVGIDNVRAVPEPSAFICVGLVVVCVAVWQKRRKN